MDRVSAYLREHWPGYTRLHCPHLAALAACLLLYADDVALLADSPALLQSLLRRFAEFCTANHLKVNAGKTKVVLAGCTADGEFRC